MAMAEPRQTTSDDPRKLRELLARSLTLATDHGLPSVIVGLAGCEDDLFLPEMISHLESSLRVEDAIFHMTRERTVLFLADVGVEKAAGIVERAIADFRKDFPRAENPPITVGYFVLGPGEEHLGVKDVLPSAFPPAGDQHVI